MIPFHFHSMQYRFKLQTQLFCYEFSQRAKEVKEKDQGHSADRTMSFKKTITKQARKLQDAQAEKLTSCEAHKIAN